MMSDARGGASLQNSFDGDHFNQNGASNAGSLLSPAMAAAAADFLPNVASLTSTTDILSSLSNLSLQSGIHGIGSTGHGPVHGLPMSTAAAFAERSLSRSSYSPTDSGISVDVVSSAATGPSQALSFSALSKLMGLNAQGEFLFSSLKFAWRPGIVYVISAVRFLPGW